LTLRASDKSESRTGARAIGKAALILRTLSTFGPQGATLKEISAAGGLPKATTHRILAALLSARLIERPDGTRNYRLGPELFAFGATIAEVFDFRGLARASLDRLAEETGDVVYLGIRSGFDGLCLDRVNGAQAPKELALDVMDRWPLGVGVFSLVLLAYLPDPEIRDVIEYNHRRLSSEEHFSWSRIRNAIEEVRRDGFAYRSTLSHRQIAGVAVPVFDRKHLPIASLCVVGTATRLKDEHLNDVVTALKREAGVIASIYETSRHRGTHREAWREVLDRA
jgi:DNA-binding IclR family transcriptional regulator